MKIAILYNVTDDSEYMDEDCLIQLNELETALTELNIQYEKFLFTTNTSITAQKLLDYKPDLAFNFVENIFGAPEIDYLPPLLLEGLNIPYTGANAISMLMTTNKILAKQYMTKFEISTPEWFDSNSFSLDITKNFTNPFIVKNFLYDSSYGITQKSIVQNSEQLLDFLESDTTGVKNNWFAERYIDGREFNISILSCNQKPTVLPIAEIIFSNTKNFAICDYDSKWDKNSSMYFETNRSFEFKKEDELLLENLKQTSLKCWDVFQLKNYARVDYRVDKNNNIWVLEVNTNPALTKDAGFIAAAAQQGLPYNNLIEHLIKETLTINNKASSDNYRSLPYKTKI